MYSNMVSKLQDPLMESVSSSLQLARIPTTQSSSMVLPSTLPPIGVRLDRSNYILWRSQIIPTTKAYGLDRITYCLSENMLAHVIHCSTSSEVWNLLEQLFSTKSKVRLLHLRFLLQTTKKGSLTIEDYILKMKSLAHELISVGQVIPDDEIMLYILR